jgi:hypothetical protein
MLTCEREHRAVGPDLQEALERQIAQRTWGRLHRLTVELKGERLLVRGYAPTYYVKQLALLAVQEVCETTPVDVEIAVGPGDARLANR